MRMPTMPIVNDAVSPWFMLRAGMCRWGFFGFECSDSCTRELGDIYTLLATASAYKRKADVVRWLDVGY